MRVLLLLKIGHKTKNVIKYMRQSAESANNETTAGESGERAQH
jgi:hypothetical protein